MKRVLIIAGLLGLIAFVSMSWAADYPAKPITIEIGYPAGGSTDLVTRALATEAGKFLGQTIICNNTPGAAGNLVLGKIKNQKPDGYVLAAAPTANVYRIPHIQESPFKASDLVPICEYSQYQYGLAVRADSPWETWEEFVDYAKKNPRKIKYSTAGVGTGQHLGMEFVAKKNGIQWSMVPFKGGVEAAVAVLGGHVDAVSQTTEFKDHVLAGKMRMLLAWNPKRLLSFPDVPTAKEKGIDVQVTTGISLWAPHGISQEIVKKLAEAFRKAAQTDAFKQVCLKFDMPNDFLGPEEDAELIRTQDKFMGEFIKSLGIGIYAPK
ncbi:MAG: tripartite tricarboxylate transporter substrate binding protein [Desulfomonile tiedjei]|nr:tripartite tricarboxylate transporter substrate binding protein [Desulfomonile tiedjei]